MSKRRVRADQAFAGKGIKGMVVISKGSWRVDRGKGDVDDESGCFVHLPRIIYARPPIPQRCDRNTSTKKDTGFQRRHLFKPCLTTNDREICPIIRYWMNNHCDLSQKGKEVCTSTLYRGKKSSVEGSSTRRIYLHQADSPASLADIRAAET